MFRSIPRRALAVLVTLCALLFAFASPASAVDVVGRQDIAVAFTLDPGAVVQLIIAFVLPVAVGLVTTRVTSAGRKAWLLAGLSLLTSLLVELGRAITAGVPYDVGVALLAALPAFVVSVASHYGLWKATGVSAAVQSVGAKHLAD
jgi:hypothetical protein